MHGQNHIKFDIATITLGVKNSMHIRWNRNFTSSWSVGWYSTWRWDL